MSYYLGYRWFDKQKKTPLYAFGHGLSYTKFDYGNLQVPCSTVTQGGVVHVTVDVQTRAPSRRRDRLRVPFVAEFDGCRRAPATTRS